MVAAPKKRTGRRMRTIKKIIFIGLVAAICGLSLPEKASAALTRLTPEHIYTWAKQKNVARLTQYRRFVNLRNKDDKTALCLAQEHLDRSSYDLLIKLGASTNVSCHKKEIAVLTREKSASLHPIAWGVLGAGAVAGAILAGSGGGGGHKDHPCPEGYTKGLDNCDKQTYPSGWNYTTSGTADGKNCGLCTPKTCQIGSTTCEQAHQGFHLTEVKNGTYAGNVSCLTCVYDCAENFFDNEQTCVGSGYICNSVTQKDKTCYYRTGDDVCPIDYPQEIPCYIGTGYINGEQTKAVGSRTCYGCHYQCDTQNGWKDGACVIGLNCQATILPTGGSCHKVMGCSEEYNYTTEEACTAGGWSCSFVEQDGVKCWRHENEAGCPIGYTKGVYDCSDKGHPEGYAYSSSGTTGGVVCGKCTARTCPTEYSKNSIAECGETRGNGWRYVHYNNLYSGELTCGYCEKLDCPDSSSTNLCEEKAYLDLVVQTAVGYHGDDRCYACTYTCAEGLYKQESLCTYGGYSCIAHETESGTCWERQGADTCPAEFPDENCSSGEGYKTASSSTIYGGRNCYKCNYSCDDSNPTAAWIERSTCPQSMTCRTITMPGGTKCTLSTGCKVGYKKGTDNTACSTEHPTGYNFTITETLGGTTCGTCTAKTCDTGTYLSPIECPSYADERFITHLSMPANPKYSAEYACETCSYDCNGTEWLEGNTCPSGKNCEYITKPDNSGTCHKVTGCSTEYSYTTQEACEASGYNCVESFNGSGCWKQTTPKNCPTSHPSETCSYSEGYEATIDSITYGGRTCLSCDYHCINDYHEMNSVPTGINTTSSRMPNGKTCYKAIGCIASLGYKEVCHYSETCNSIYLDANDLIKCYKPNGCATGYYSSLSDCQADGYICDTTYDGSTCYKRVGSQNCPTTHPSETACSRATGYITTEDHTTYGDRDCYKCNYACDSANNWENTKSSAALDYRSTSMPSGGYC